MQREAQEALAAFVGLDWADAQYDVCLPATGTERRAFLQLAQRPAAIDAWVHTLRTRCNGPPVAGCLELQKGPRVSALRQDEFLVLCPVHPLTVATYRDALTPSRAQDDPPDAALPVALLRKHRDTLTPLAPHSAMMRTLAQRVAHRRRLVGDQVRLTQRLTRALKNSCPHVLQGFPDKETVLFGDVRSRWPTLTAAPRARRTTLEAFCRAQHVRAAAVMASRLQALKRARALTTDDGVITPNALLVHALIAQLRVTLQAIADFDTALAQRAQAHPDFPLFDALPGAGAVFAPRLLVACGAQRDRCTSAEDLQK
jgi:Transposase